MGKAFKKEGGQAPRRQYAALPYRTEADGAVSVLLIVSRETRRWVIPKGWPMKGKKPYQAAAREAFEEAGVVGSTARKPFGAYLYEKRLPDGGTVPCEVKVYPMAVARQRRKWPERRARGAGTWFPVEEASTLVAEEGLSSLILTLPSVLERGRVPDDVDREETREASFAP